MKTFTLIGMTTNRQIIMEDDEMLEWKIIKIKNYEDRCARE